MAPPDGVPEWAAEIREAVASQGATLEALKGKVSYIQVALDAHCARKNGENLKAMLALGGGIGIGLGGMGAGLLKLLGG